MAERIDKVLIDKFKILLFLRTPMNTQHAYTTDMFIENVVRLMLLEAGSEKELMSHTGELLYEWITNQTEGNTDLRYFLGQVLLHPGVSERFTIGLKPILTHTPVSIHNKNVEVPYFYDGSFPGGWSSSTEYQKFAELLKHNGVVEVLDDSIFFAKSMSMLPESTQQLMADAGLDEETALLVYNYKRLRTYEIPDILRLATTHMLGVMGLTVTRDFDIFFIHLLKTMSTLHLAYLDITLSNRRANAKDFCDWWIDNVEKSEIWGKALASKINGVEQYQLLQIGEHPDATSFTCCILDHIGQFERAFEAGINQYNHPLAKGVDCQSSLERSDFV